MKQKNQPQILFIKNSVFFYYNYTLGIEIIILFTMNTPLTLKIAPKIHQKHLKTCQSKPYTIEIPLKDAIQNSTIHSRPSQIKYITNNGKRAISTANTNEDRQKWRYSQSNSHKKFKTQQTCRSYHSKEAEQRYYEQPERFQKIVTNQNNYSKIDRVRRKTVCTSQGQRRDQTSQRQYKLFNDNQIKIEPQRLKSQPLQIITSKQEIIKRINKKVSLVKKMTPLIEQEQNPMIKISNIIPPSQSATLFKFDRLYDHCLKKLKKCINIYEKDLNKSKDRQYFELKIESNILSKQFKAMRNSLVKKKEDNEDIAQPSMGIIGKNIDVKYIEKNNLSRGLTVNSKKKIGRIHKIIEEKNPFTGDEMEGWDIRLERGEDFYI